MSEKTFNHITILIYAHPELYPPTLSAIEELSKIAGKIDIVTRNMLRSDWNYPSNVTINYINKNGYHGYDIEKIPLLLKAIHFVKFIIQSQNVVKQNRSKLIIAYDVIPLYISHLIKKTIKKQGGQIWYHNHDITDLKGASRYSLMSIAAKKQEKAIQSISLFSLPSNERVTYFNNLPKGIKPILIPNYPHTKFYSKVTKKNKSEINKLKLVYQGSIGPGHGLEDIINILHKRVNKKILELHLVGKVRPKYLSALQGLAVSNKVSNQLFYHGVSPFSKLPKILSDFDVGIATHTPYNITYATGGSASNKIYEYVALGLPVLLFDNKHYRLYLESHCWSYFTDLSEQSLSNILKKIDDNWEVASVNAIKDFQNNYNFENAFLTMRKELSKKNDALI